MGVYRKKYYPNHSVAMTGLTLIEVIIALAIIGIAMTAVIKVSSQNIRATNYLQTKSIANWIGQEAMNETLLGIIHVPGASNQFVRSQKTLGSDWHFTVSAEDTPNPHIKKITVHVFAKEQVEDNEIPIITLESYLYHEE